MDDYTLSTRKLILIIVAFIAVLGLLQWLIGYLTTGKIIINTDSRYDEISISSISRSTTAKKGFYKQAEGSLTTKLKAGGYFVSIQNGANGSNQYVKIKGRTTTRLNVHLLNTTGVEPVIYTSAQNIVADSSQLRYLDPDNTSVERINKRNELSKINIDYNLHSISWADTTYGVGQNAAGQLFVIDHDSIKPLGSPISNRDSTGAIYSVAPNRKIYIGIGSSVYAGSDKNGFKKIYNNLLPNSILVAGSNTLSILTNGYTGNKPQVTIIDNHGKQHSKKFDGFLNGWSTWSKDDRYFVVVEGARGDVFDPSLHQIATIPQSNIVYADWSDSDILFYSIGSQLWSFNVNQQTSHLIANMPFNSPIKSISVSTDNSYVYLVTQSNDANENQTIRRVGLKDQHIPNYIYQLQDIMPLNLDSYSLSLVNFSSPANILVQPYPGNTSVNITNQAKVQLQQLKFNPNVFRYQVSPIEP